MRFAGYAALFGVADAGRDTIRPGAFARTLRERAEPLPLLWEHRPGQRIGVVRFASDRLEVSAAAFAAGEAPSVPLVEVREAA